MLFIFSTPVLIRHLRQLKTAVFLHWCLIHTVLLQGCLGQGKTLSLILYRDVGDDKKFYNFDTWSVLSVKKIDIFARSSSTTREISLGTVSLKNDETNCSILKKTQNLKKRFLE
jgi:hypothetical protein